MLNEMDKLDGENGKNLHRTVKLWDTRWTANYNAVKNIKDQNYEFKRHLQNVIDAGPKNYMAETLRKKYDDYRNYLFFTIIKPILILVNKINKMFQKEKVNVNTAYD